jgi:hypothetical protein
MIQILIYYEFMILIFIKSVPQQNQETESIFLIFHYFRYLFLLADISCIYFLTFYFGAAHLHIAM